jgi:hypothetical protein
MEEERSLRSLSDEQLDVPPEKRIQDPVSETF